MTFQDAYALYGKYIGDWGAESTEFKFVGYMAGKPVITRIKAPWEAMDLDINISSTTLVEGSTYDVAEVRIKVVDQNGNVLTFFNGNLDVSTEGPIEIYGPDRVDIRGGMGGVYVRTTGETGNALLKVNFIDGVGGSCFDIIKTVEFNVVGGQ